MDIKQGPGGLLEKHWMPMFSSHGRDKAAAVALNLWGWRVTVTVMVVVNLKGV